MSTNQPDDRPLRRALRANALFSSLSGLSFLLFAGALTELFGIGSTTVLYILGPALLLFAVDLLHISTRPMVSKPWVLGVIVADAAWVLATAVLLLGFDDLLNSIGVAAALGIAATVGVLCVWQALGLRILVRPGNLNPIGSR